MNLVYHTTSVFTNFYSCLWPIVYIIVKQQKEVSPTIFGMYVLYLYYAITSSSVVNIGDGVLEYDIAID